MLRKLSTLVLVLALSLAVYLPAFAASGQPNFSAGIYADGMTFGTKGTTELPAPTDDNLQSFDYIYIIVNSNNPDGQLPVAEAAPGNPDYNGGRWIALTVEWTPAGFAAHGTVPVLKSLNEVMVHYNLGHLMFTLGHPVPGAPTYFQCPLLPVK